MPFLPAPAEPRHIRGGAGGAGRAETVPPWHGQMIKLSKRIWGQGGYSHGAVRYAAQIAALDHPVQRCRAGVVTLAGYMGDSKRTAERYLAELALPGPDGVPETTVIRHTDPGGDGATAERRMRGVARGEHFAYVPVCAAKALRPALFVLYCALTYAEATRTPVTAAELGSLLGVTERSARRLIDELEALGWAAVERRAGYQGRHVITTSGCPDHDAPQAWSPDTDGGSGAGRDGGSLAIKEDPRLTDGRTTEVRGSFRRRRDDRKWVAAPVDTVGNTAKVPPPLRGRVRPAERPAERPAYAGPPLALSPRVWAVLTPVRDLLPAAGDFAVRRIAREIGRQLDDGIFAEDIRDQLQRLRSWTPREEIRDPGRWILGAALPARPGRCSTADCHYGFQRFTGLPCKACADLEANRARGHPPHTAGPSPHACTACHWTSPTPLPYGRCAACRPA